MYELRGLKKIGVNIYKDINQTDLSNLISHDNETILADSYSQIFCEKLNSYLYKALNIEIDSDSMFESKTMLLTGQKKIFAGGDMTRTPGRFMDAVKDGRRAALLINEKLEFLHKF